MANVTGAGRASVHEQKVYMAKNDEVTRSKVELKGDDPVILYQSDRDVSMEEIKELCEVNEIEVPVEGDSRYWEMVGDFRSWDYDDFEATLKTSKKLPGLIVITGELGLWDGTHTIIPVMMDMAADPMKVFRKFALASDFEMRIGYDKEGLFVTVHHHDGTNRFHIKEVTTAGQRYLERCERHGVESDILSEEKFTKPIDYWLY